MTSSTDYVLGHDTLELERLEQQAQALAPATRAILSMAGIAPGMRVLDLGTGAGDVALLVAEMVGPEGVVVGIDQSPDALDWAIKRVANHGLDNVSFVEGDLHHVELDGTFDAVVGRLVLLYTPDPSVVLSRYAALVRPGGKLVAMEFEMTAAGTLPDIPLSSLVTSWIVEAFARSGHDPVLGARLQEVFEQAGLSSPTVLGLQGYHQPGDERAGRLAAGLIRTILPLMERTGVATSEEVDVDTLATRINRDVAAAGAIFTPPTLVGAWATVDV